MRFAYKDGDQWQERGLLRFIIIIGDIILWFLLVNISPAYFILLFGLFSQVFRHLPLRYAIIAASLLTGAITFEQLSDSDQTFSLADPLLWFFLFVGAAGILLGIWISAIIGQSTRRRELIEQLEGGAGRIGRGRTA